MLSKIKLGSQSLFSGIMSKLLFCLISTLIMFTNPHLAVFAQENDLHNENNYCNKSNINSRELNTAPSNNEYILSEETPRQEPSEELSVSSQSSPDDKTICKNPLTSEQDNKHTIRENELPSYDVLTEDRVSIKPGLGYNFHEELPAPSSKKNGGGEPIENLVPAYGKSYIDDDYLKDDVIRFRRWDWKELYESLDRKAKERPEHLNTYRLQAEIYMINKNYNEAFSQIDHVLRRDPLDIHALTLSVLASKVTGNQEQLTSRLAVLKEVSPSVYEELTEILDYTDANNAYQINYGGDPLTNIKPDAIAVFGQSPNSDGTPSKGLLERLEKTKEMAERFPDIPIVLSGGPVRYSYAEADVMAKWLKDNGVDETRLILDDIARDTPGNAIGMVKAFKACGAKNILAIGTILHLPRAKTVLKLYGDFIGYPMNIDTAGGGQQPSAKKLEIERLYTYVNAFRAAFLFTKDDFERFPRRSVLTDNSMTQRSGGQEIQQDQNGKINHSSDVTKDSITRNTNQGNEKDIVDDIYKNRGSIIDGEHSQAPEKNFEQKASETTDNFRQPLSNLPETGNVASQKILLLGSIVSLMGLVLIGFSSRSKIIKLLKEAFK